MRTAMSEAGDRLATLFAPRSTTGSATNANAGRVKRIVRAAAAGAAATAGMVLLAAAPATAVDGWQRTTDVGGAPSGSTCATSGYGQACFQSYGEWIWLRDSYTNGEPVAMEWSYYGADGERHGVAYWDGGTAAGWTNLNKSFAEYGDFNFRVCEVDLPSRTIVQDTCSTWTWAQT